jgi:hypothetical protein
VQVQQTALHTETTERVPIPRERPAKLRACARHRFSCDWPKLSEGLNDLKKLFTAQKTAKRS